MQRSLKQNASLHKWCRMLAEELTEIGYDMRQIKVEIKPTEENVKEYFFKEIMRHLYPDIESTTELSTGQMIEVADVLNQALGQRLGIHVPWPCEETQYQKAVGHDR